MTKLKTGLAFGAILFALGASGAKAQVGNFGNLPIAGGGAAWAQSTQYGPGAYVQANGNTYQMAAQTAGLCTSNGTGTGPTGSRALLRDGTCTWAYVGPAYATTYPLTGGELVPADTNLPQGLNPASERITTAQLANAVATLALGFTNATSVAAFTATTGQVVPASCGGTQVLLLNGTLTAGAALTTPTATAIEAICPNVPTSWIVKFVNNSSGAFAWTITGGTGVTVTGTATVAQGNTRNFLLTTGTTTGSPSVVLQDLGS